MSITSSRHSTKNEKTSSAYAITEIFENTIAEYAGSKYAVAVESCTFALFLCCKWFEVKTVILPKKTYPGVACSVIHAGGKCQFENIEWMGTYELKPYPIIDSAVRFKKGMYIKDSFYCLSFHGKKHLNIGRGGMILCNNRKAVEWFRRARFDGRNPVPLAEDRIEQLGWNGYMTPEQAARGLELFGFIKDKYLQDSGPALENYPDLSRFKVYAS